MKLELKRRIRTWFTFQTFVVLITLLWLIGQLPFLGWPGDLASHFQMQYAVLSLIGIAVALAKRTWKFLPPLLVVFGFSLSALLPYWPSAQPVATDASQPRLRLMQVNVLFKNPDRSRVAQAIEQFKPDILSLQEVDPRWPKALENVLKQYPYRLEHVVWKRSCGLALYSKIPLKHRRIRDYGNVGRAVLIADIQLGEQTLSIATLHPHSPGWITKYWNRDRQLLAFARERQQFHQNLIVMGDLNTTPFSPVFKNFMQLTGLQDSRIGRGYMPAWPSVWPLLWIPIDHILVSPQFEVHLIQTGPYIGSDHLPVIIDLALKKSDDASTAEPTQAQPSPAKATDLL